MRTVDITPHLQRVYAVLLYDTEPVYLMVVAHKPKSEWKVVTVNWNTEYDKVIPGGVFGEEHPHP